MSIRQDYPAENEAKDEPVKIYIFLYSRNLFMFLSPYYIGRHSMDKTDKEIKEIKKLNADAYAKNMEARWDKINAEILKKDKEIKTKSDRLVKALEDLKNKNRRLKDESKEFGKKKLIRS